MRTKLTWVLGLLAAANGVFMLVAPAAWYAIVPGVPDTGPFNTHFIRDIAAAFLVAGGALVWCARDARARPAALGSAAFFTLHALVHLGDDNDGARIDFSGHARPADHLPGCTVSALDRVAHFKSGKGGGKRCSSGC